MEREKVWKTLNDMGAIIRDDHFVYTKGDHGSEYVNKDALFMHPQELSVLCEDIAVEFKNAGVDVVLGPAVGGALIAQWVAFHLQAASSKTVRAIYADKDGSGFVLKRGYDAFVPGNNVLVAEDIWNTGESAEQVVKLARSLGGNVVGAAALCNRGGVRLWDLGNPPRSYSVVAVNMKKYPADACPLCNAGKPINIKIGKGAGFVAKHGQPKVSA